LKMAFLNCKSTVSNDMSYTCLRKEAESVILYM